MAYMYESIFDKPVSGQTWVSWTKQIHTLYKMADFQIDPRTQNCNHINHKLYNYMYDQLKDFLIVWLENLWNNAKSWLKYTTLHSRD